ncbi:MAG TPA: orotidine-5'-phosphate decarboxylase [Pyrinomonadaceae bacterium]|jgi:orotidine-5'-phosphate decarboxylase|nr:orotidine-5'-phosphate decarboxylase [Pyrinomonadaceae bacterium]
MKGDQLTAKDKLIVALDVDTPAKALDLVKELHGVAGMFKIGSTLFTSAGPQIVRDIINRDCKVFLDLKFHDIPHQVAGAARSAAELGVSLFTIHASGGSEMMRRAVDSVNEIAAKGGVRARVLAISVLTSIDATILSQIGVSSSPSESVLRLVRLAGDSGVDGVVASPQEIKTIRAAVSNPGFLVVTPGIRPSTNEPEREDQKRVATPAAAITAGASYLVVGRPITGAADPVTATRKIVAEMQEAEALLTKGTD